jgi:hypothetical protein
VCRSLIFSKALLHCHCRGLTLSIIALLFIVRALLSTYFRFLLAAAEFLACFEVFAEPAVSVFVAAAVLNFIAKVLVFVGALLVSVIVVSELVVSEGSLRIGIYTFPIHHVNTPAASVIHTLVHHCNKFQLIRIHSLPILYFQFTP